MKKILLIDDDQLFREMFKQVLLRENYDVVEACDGKEGIRKFIESSPDLVITDIIMPDQEGIETISKLRLENKNVPIIAISGGGRIGPESYLPLALGLGAQKTFTKPFDHKEMLVAVAECLED